MKHIAMLAAGLSLLAACKPESVDVPDVAFGEPPYAAVDLAGASGHPAAAAWVTLIEFLDYSCRYCAEEFPTVDWIRANRSADVRVAIEFVTAHGDPSARAARAAWCADQQGSDEFWRMHLNLFANQGQFSDEQLAALAAYVQLDTGAWNECYGSEAAQEAVGADMALSAAIGVEATPSFVINGKLLTGTYSAEAMDELVDRALSAAQASGCSTGAQYYDTVILGGGSCTP